MYVALSVLDLWGKEKSLRRSPGTSYFTYKRLQSALFQYFHFQVRNELTTSPLTSFAGIR